MQHTQLRPSTFFSSSHPAETHHFWTAHPRKKLVLWVKDVPTCYCRHNVLQPACTKQAPGEVFEHMEASAVVMIKLISQQQSSCYSLMDNNKAAVMCDLQQFTVHHRDQN